MLGQGALIPVLKEKQASKAGIKKKKSEMFFSIFAYYILQSCSPTEVEAEPI